MATRALWIVATSYVIGIAAVLVSLFNSPSDSIMVLLGACVLTFALNTAAMLMGMTARPYPRESRRRANWAIGLAMTGFLGTGVLYLGASGAAMAGG